MRVLILDFDVFSTRGGGQTFYRRVIERHPGAQILYLSRGPDLRRRNTLPPNALPVALDSRARDPHVIGALNATGLPWCSVHEVDMLCAIGRALQGESLDVVEVPSYRPCAHQIRPVLAAYGVRVGRICLGLLGWVSVSLREAETLPDDQTALQQLEAATIAAADTCYTVSALHASENAACAIPTGIVDMHDALEEFASPEAEPPGEGPPDLWYVGRLDGAKGPDLFLAMAARLPRGLYGRLSLAGPDSDWLPRGQRWSDALQRQAMDLGLDIVIHHALGDAALRSEVYAGRSVLVIPSRTDTFNLVAMEALAHGVPILLSRHTGAAGFLAQHHAAIAPAVIEPRDTEAAAVALRELLSHYPARSRALRATLRAAPLPKPRQGFLDGFWRDARLMPDVEPRRDLFSNLRSTAPLAAPAALPWRPRHNPAGPLTAIVVVRDNMEALRGTLAALVRQSRGLGEILIVDDGSHVPAMLDIAPGESIQLLRQGPRGLAAAFNRGCVAARSAAAQLFLAGDLPGPDCAAAAAAAFDPEVGEAVTLPWAWLAPGGLAPDNAATAPGWGAPALLCATGPLLAAGGFASPPGDGNPLPPPSLRLIAVPGAAPLVWRPRDATAPWRTGPAQAEGIAA